jgi:putative DNA primase/helicase
MFEKVPGDLLEALAGMPGPSVNPKVENDDKALRSLLGSNSTASFDVERWLLAHNVQFVRREPWNGGTRWILSVCPFNPEHTDSNKAIVGQLANGAIIAKCQHASCSGKKWHDMRDIVEPGWRERREDVEPLEAVNDPHRLARIYLETECSHEEGLTLRYHRGDYFAWDGVAHREEPAGDLESRLNGAIKREFDRESIEAQQKGDDKRLVARQVTGAVVGNVKLALRGQILIPSSLNPPCWIGDTGPWAASDVLPAPNGLFHIPSLIEGIDDHLEPTPRFFSTFALDYAIELNAPRPETWLAFLEQVWSDDPQCVATLQEFMGYLLTQDTSQHKMLTIIGPPRSGKGVISRVITGLIGTENVAGTTLTSLRASFGLEDLVGKALAIIPDARLKGRSDTVLERLLSITGEDVLTVERKHKTSLNVKLPTRIILNSNEMPEFDDASGALVNRMILLRMTESFLGREDRTLTHRCLAERAGILLWSLDGLRRLRERGHFLQPDSAIQFLSEMEELASPVKEFVRDRCNVGPFLNVARADLYAAYVKWCGTTGRKLPEAPNTFGRKLHAAVKNLGSSQPRPGGEERPRYYTGIGLRPD